MSQRLRSRRTPGIIDERVLLSSAGSSTTSAGALAAVAWLRARGLTPPRTSGWQVEIALGTSDTSQFVLEIDHRHWGFSFSHGGCSSSISVVALPIVIGADDYDLVGRTPPLQHVGQLVRSLEQEHRISLRRSPPRIEADLDGLESAARSWLSTL